MKTIFEQKILIAFGSCDPQGILYFANTFKLAHECLEAYWAQTELGWCHWFQNPEFAVPIRHSECDYLKPIRAGESYLLKMSCLRVGDSSAELVCQISSGTGAGSGDSLCATVKTVHVFVDRKNFAKISVPENVRAKLV